VPSGAANEIYPVPFGVKVTLPDSGEEFGLASRSPAKAAVPANLLTIGTMNTADRSIALRQPRSHSERQRGISNFICWRIPEIPRKLGMTSIGDVAGVPLGKLLTALNWKLEAILGPKFIRTETIKVGTGDSVVYRLRSITEDTALVQALTELAGS
jgi:hypothetical protein